MIKGLNYYGVVGAGDGYANSAEQYILALSKHVEVSVARIGTARKTLPETEKILAQPFRMHDVGIVHSFPNAFDYMMLNKFRIGFTMFETTKLPSGVNEWTGKSGDAATEINTHTDMLFVPSMDNKLLFQRHGVAVPIRVLHNGIRAGQFPYHNRRLNRRLDQPFTFLMMGSLTTRKNSGLVISAFIDLHKQMPNARLILKTQSGTHGHMYFDKDACGDIEIIDESWTDEQIAQLMKDSDCMVFPTHGEGFGLPPIEAMATGMPTIIAAHSGMLEYADNRYNWAVKSPELVAAERFPQKWGDVGYWYQPDMEDLKRHMLDIYNNQNAAFDKGDRASKWVHENFNYDRLAVEMLDSIEEVMNGV